MGKPVVLAVSGVKNSGKTTLIEGIIPRLTAKGLVVAVIKHDGHRFLSDPPGTDTDRQFKAGACGTAIFDGEKIKVVRRSRETEAELIACFPEADLILLEGFKNSSWPKLELVRSGNSEEPVCAPATLLALVSDLPLEAPNAPTFDLNDLSGVAALVERYVREEREHG